MMLMYGNASPPSRAAWIEIDYFNLRCVDCGSPPSRAAWIEIPAVNYRNKNLSVAAFTGGVD